MPVRESSHFYHIREKISTSEVNHYSIVHLYLYRVPVLIALFLGKEYSMRDAVGLLKTLARTFPALTTHTHPLKTLHPSINKNIPSQDLLL
jgi:hypothetical protein